MKKAVALLFLSIGVHAASVLDIGTSYRLRGISYTNTDFGATPDQDFSYYSQRAQAHIGGRFSPNIEMMLRLQGLNVVGSSSPANTPSVDPTGNRYPNTSFTPWLQN